MIFAIKRIIVLIVVLSLVQGLVACNDTELSSGHDSLTDTVIESESETNTESGTKIESESSESEAISAGSDTAEDSETSSTETHTNTESETETMTEKYEQTKTLNGVPIENYEIICQNETYGALRAAEYLSDKILEISGHKIKINLNSNFGDNVIVINDVDDTKGEFFVESAGSWIAIGGSGITGPYKAAQCLIAAMEGHADVEIDSVTSPIATLDGCLELIEGGKISIGFIGDSVTYGHGPVTPWPTYFIESMQKAYPDTTFRYENVAVSGKKSTWAAENIKKLLLKKKLADIVFIAIGTNDKYQQGSLDPVLGDQTKANYISMIEQIKDVNPDAQIVFVLCTRDYEMKGIEGVGGEVSPFIDAMLEVSDEYGMPIIDPMSALYDECAEHSPDSVMGEGWRYYMQDEVHPNERGQELYGDVVYEYIKRALK